LNGKGDVSDAINEVQDETLLKHDPSGRLTGPVHFLFDDLIGALYEYKQQIRNENLASIAKTSIAELFGEPGSLQNASVRL